MALPPILVHRSTMRIIDGMHRIRVAMLRGQDEIDVEFFDGSEDEAFMRAVEQNVRHGLPLSLSDRRSAAMCILASHPEVSDRAIAALTALSSKTVGAIRRNSTVESTQANARIGGDGRWRPLDCTEGRLRASEMMAANPAASLRQIAKAAGVSLGTAHDVRRRITRGEGPVPSARVPGSRVGPPRAPEPPSAPEPPPRPPLTPAPAPRQGRSTPSPAAGPEGARDIRSSVTRLAKDPSLRNSDAGRELLRLLHMHISVTEQPEMVGAVPAHCLSIVAKAAQQCSHYWDQVADALERRARTDFSQRD
jgi:hypothetical protein